MRHWMLLIIGTMVFTINRILASNHYVMKEDGFIKRRLDSPFHLRQPENLLKFLNQMHCNDQAEEGFKKMQRRRNRLDDHILITAQLMQQIIEKSKCARIYVKLKGAGDYLRTTGASLKRLRVSEKMEKDDKNGEPVCKNYIDVTTADYVYNKLRSFTSEVVQSMKIEREEHLLQEEFGLEDAESVTETMRSIAVKGLLNNPQSWKFHMLGSYYWRLVGNVKNALECARLSVLLAPEESRDIPLLSLGTILVRAKMWDDAEIILNAAVNNGSEHSENYVALATLFALKHNFKRAREYFKIVEKLNTVMYSSTYTMRQYIDCLEPLDNEASKLFGYVKYMMREIKDVNKLRQDVTVYQNKIIQQQVPLASRYNNNDAQLKTNLLSRYQYCSTRQASDTQASTVFCDFYSDLQMQLESKQFDAELLEWQVNHYKNRLFERMPKEYKSQLEFLYNTAKPILPIRKNT
uniref:Uncharacterized protein n=1 Tax=Glossina morsitans morsitans TaxID=37546 RepID=A0A1B0FQ82_GLOMM